MALLKAAYDWHVPVEGATYFAALSCEGAYDVAGESLPVAASGGSVVVAGLAVLALVLVQAPKRVKKGHIGPYWSQYGYHSPIAPIWPKMGYFGAILAQNGPFWAILGLLGYGTQLGPYWPKMALFDPFLGVYGPK